MLLANQRLQDGNQILARIMSLLKSILGKRELLSTSMFIWGFLKKFLNVLIVFLMKYCLLELPYLYLTATNKKEFTGKNSLNSFRAESSEKQN